MKAGAPAKGPGIERLSALLDRVVSGGGSEVTVQEIVDRTGGRGLYLLVVVLCLPFTTPVPLPGVSTVLGAVIAWIALASLRGGGQTARLPGWLGRRRIPVEGQRRVLAASRRFVLWIERLAKPRRSAWMLGEVGRRLHALLLAGLATLLMLPLPVPFTNSLPGYAIIFVSVSLMEGDGRLVFVGYVLAIVALVYIIIALGALVAGGAGALGWGWNWLLGSGVHEP